jgi:hypothetical protein
MAFCETIVECTKPVSEKIKEAIAIIVEIIFKSA